MAQAHGPGKPWSPQNFHYPLNDQLIDGDHDLFGDGRLVLIPTYGYTPWRQSLWVRDGQALHPVYRGGPRQCKPQKFCPPLC